MIKQIITVIILLIVALGLFTLSKSLSSKVPPVPEAPMEEVPQGKLPPGSTPVGATSDIENVTWVWTETISNGDTSIVPKKAGAFSLVLSEGKVTGKTDCNSFFGSYQIGSDGKISFGPLGSTKMFCEGSQETEFTGVIELTSNYTLNNGNLVLFQQDAGVSTFRKATSQDVTVSIGEKKTVDTLSITLNKFVQDSRCPIDVTCIQAGAVTVNVTMTDGVKTETKNFPSDEAPQTFGAYKVSIVGIEPARESTKVIADKDYKITFRVEK